MGGINWKKSYGYYDPNGKFYNGFLQNNEAAINNFFDQKDEKGDYINRTNDWRDFFTALGVMESSYDSDKKDKGFGADNGEGYYGKYQQGIDVLKDTKFFDKEGKPTSCVNDLKDFLKNPYAQEIAALREFSGLNSNTSSKYNMVKNGFRAVSREFTGGDPKDPDNY